MRSFLILFILLNTSQAVATITLNCVKIDPKSKGGQCHYKVTALNEAGVKAIIGRNSKTQKCEDTREEQSDQNEAVPNQNKNEDKSKT